MLYHPPVGRSWEEYYRDWYIASKFGEQRAGYFHSGDDVNLKTGGDSDLGQSLYAVADGVISGTDTVSTTGFGKQIFEKIIFEGRTLWTHYAHCLSVDVKPGQEVKAGQYLGKLGKSGTTWAHLHFSIKNKPNGMDNVPNTREELKQWENPSTILRKMYELSKNDSGNGATPMPNDLEKLQHYFGIQKAEDIIARCTEHLGERDGKCIWGERGEDGGWLGKERQKTADLQADLEKCENGNSGPSLPIQLPDGFEIDGFIVKRK